MGGLGFRRVSKAVSDSDSLLSLVLTLDRTVVLWFLISRVVCVATDIPCFVSAGFEGIPLPAGKNLWEANMRSTWQAEYEVSNPTYNSRLSFVGDLIDAQKRAGEVPNKWKLDAWRSEVDNLGMLLTLATATVC